MFAKSYTDHIATLKKREVRPSFEKMSTLLDSHESKAALFAGRSLGPVWFVGGGAALLVALLLPFAPPGGVQLAGSRVANSVSVNGLATEGTQATPSSNEGISRASNLDALWTNRVEYQPVRVNLSKEGLTSPAMVSDSSAHGQQTNEDSDHAINPLNSRTIPVPPGASSGNKAAIAMPVGAPHESSLGRYYIGLGGSLAQEMGPTADYRMLSAKNAFVSTGYVFSSRLSIGIIASQEKFIVSRMTNTTIFHPVTTVQNGVTYSNLIGESVPTPAPITVQLLSIAGTVRYSIEDDPTSPYVELLGGGSSEGALAETSLGMSLLQFGSLSLDGNVFARTLIPLSGATLTKFGVSAAVRFEW